MEQNLGFILMGIGVLLSVCEIFVPGFVLFPIGIGAIGSGILSYFSLPLTWTLLAWSVISIITWLSLRKFFLVVSDNDFKSGSDALVGERAKVIKVVLPNDDTGRIKVYGDEWEVINLTDRQYNVGESVEIQEVVGNKVKLKIN